MLPFDPKGTKLPSMRDQDNTLVPSSLINTTTLQEEGAVDLFILDTLEELYPHSFFNPDNGPFSQVPLNN